jgi:uncharacterized SAM-binding protein YcdF (DUF218 family)
MSFAVVFGKKPRKGERIHPELKLRVKKALELLDEKEVNSIIITGGATRKGLPSEADVAAEGIPSFIKDHHLHLECEARSTAERILNVKKMFTDRSRIDGLTIITGPYHVPRTRLLFRYLWPKILPRLSFSPVGPYSLREIITEAILFPIAFIGFILSLLKKFFKDV